MQIPNYQTYMRSVLKHVADGEEHQLSKLINTICDDLGLTQEQRHQKMPSGKQTVVYGRIGWAKTYLAQAGLLTLPKRGYCVITQRGLDALNSDVEINNDYLKQFPEYIAFKERTHTNVDDNKPRQQHSSLENEQTPHELLENTYNTINSALASDILDAILKASPEFFERLVVDLMLAMGYGGTRKDAGQATQYTQDGGIDGIIKEDKLGLEMIYLQAKRYSNKTVGRPEIQAFAGALDMHRAKKGVFITTSSFSKEAIEYVSLIEKRIVLINGEQLTELMLSHDLGVSTKQVYELKALDSDYFIED
ncbi:restriction endonuclease [Thalassomonas viridans]|uniref:Restriction endonuclease n=1 Tax=Thalassomonas viridans TaxID=137584 RepID=A0AAE9Z7H2_9GAMM|nr:restriction endonuclease [Thalassomonas viridans]WDE07938.1 restriction endonuclease [Thalassomonas viridans]